MNDFTKEELEFLKDYINYAVSYSYGPTGDKSDKIYNKIQSLIENYCEPCSSAHDFYECLVCDHCGLIKNIEF